MSTRAKAMCGLSQYYFGKLVPWVSTKKFKCYIFSQQTRQMISVGCHEYTFFMGFTCNTKIISGISSTNLGGIPYAHVSNELLLKYLMDGNRLQWPEICSEELYKLMRRCWSESSDDRPFFAEIVQLLEQKENNAHVYVNFDSIASNYVLPPTMPVESGHLDV